MIKQIELKGKKTDSCTLTNILLYTGFFLFLISLTIINIYSNNIYKPNISNPQLPYTSISSYQSQTNLIDKKETSEKKHPIISRIKAIIWFGVILMMKVICWKN